MEGQIAQMAAFALNAEFNRLEPEVVEKVKIHLLDSLASLLHAAKQPTMQKLQRQLSFFQSSKKLKVDQLPIDRLGQYYTALIRYPDFMDNFLAKESTCHPADNIGGLLAVGKDADVSGKEFITAMAVAYEIQCRLIEQMPVMVNGYDHTVHLNYSLSAAAGKLLALKQRTIEHAMAMNGCSYNPLVTGRAAYTPEWKGFASSLVTLGCINTLYLAREGMTGPTKLFEIPKKGFNDIQGMKLKYNWASENFELVKKCILKSYNAEVHTQSAVEATLDLREEHDIDVNSIETITITTFMTAYHIVGGGEYGSRMQVHTKEQADHSLPYVIAVMLLDGQLYPEQLKPERIERDDVQALLKKVKVKKNLPFHEPVKVMGLLDPYTVAYPDKMKTKVEIKFNDGRIIVKEKEDYKGFFTNQLTKDDVVLK